MAMLDRIFEFSVRNRFLVIVCACLLVAVGIYSLQRLPIDAVPDVTPNQVQILTVAPGIAPVEIEQFVTFPVELAMAGLPGITRIWSTSRFGLSVVTVYFKESMDIYFCRRLVMERLPKAREMIPAGFGTPEMGPISTGLGEIYQFEVRGKGYSLMQLRAILDWDIALKLKTVPGVVEVNSYGGQLKTYEVQLDAAKLVSYDLPITKVYNALEQNNANAGGGYIEHSGDQYVIPAEGLVKTTQDIGNIVVATRGDGTPIRISDLGKVVIAPMLRQGAVTRDGRGEVVTGVVMMLIGENSRIVARQVHEKIEEIQKTLPPGVTIDTYYDRTDLVNRTIHTVTKNLSEGAILVIVVLLLLLGNLRAGLIVASAIPLSMLVAFTGMVYAGVSGNLMSLGALDFGLIVDGSVVMIENIIRLISERGAAERKSALSDDEMQALVLRAGREVLRPIFFAVGIIIMVYLPILTLQGVEGKMFRPMAITVVFALVGALVLSFTLMPVLATLFLRKGAGEKETWLVRQAQRWYRPLLDRAIARPLVTGAVAAGLFIISVAVAPFLGAEFIPRLDEGTIAVQAWRLPSVSLEEAVRNTTMIEKVLKRFPEAKTVVSRTGSAEIPTDPMGPETSDIYVILKPRETWKTAHTQAGLIRAFDAALETNVPGTTFSYSQPIELRVQELIAGVRSDVSIMIFGEDLKELANLGDEVVRVVSAVPGASETKAERVAGLSYLRVIVNRAAISRYGINASDILETVRAIGGRVVGQVLEGQKRFAIQVRFSPRDREQLESIGDLRISDGKGGLIPLRQLATLNIEDGPAQISRDDFHRRLAVETNVRGSDLAGFVAAAQRAVVQRVKLPPGYWIVWGGQFENLQRAGRRLMIVVPLALFLIFILLYSTFDALKPAALIYLNVPVAATGGVFALALRGMPFSISAAVGFIALFGVAVLNGVVLMSYVLQMRREGLSAREAALRGGEIRLRPVLMTALVAALGFVPMAVSTSAGAEVQRPLATVVIGGLLTSTPLTLLVLPSLYAWIESRHDQVGEAK
jgi:cobalt-zinc-cadmium resistance protein CzcA